MTNRFIGKPFKGLRPTKNYADKIVAPPYDVVSKEQVYNIVKSNPDSFLRVSRAEVDFNEAVDPYSNKVYNQAANNFNKLLELGIIRADETEFYYIYRIRSENHTQTGIAFAASIEAYREGKIKRHELTREKKELDRIMQIRAVRAQTGPVMLINRKNHNLKSTLDKITQKKLPEISTMLEDWKHEIWVVNKPEEILEIDRHLNSIQDFYIADGHHRSAAASKISEKPFDLLSCDSFLAVSFDETELKILPYNRVIRDLNQFTSDEFLAKLSNNFTVKKTKLSELIHKKYIYYIYLEHCWYQLRLKEFPTDTKNILNCLDTQIIENLILRPILNITKIRTDNRIEFVGGPKSAEKIMDLVDSGVMKLGIALPPTGIEELIKISDEGGLMPPKSTWFEPKLADGLISLKI